MGREHSLSKWRKVLEVANSHFLPIGPIRGHISDEMVVLLTGEACLILVNPSTFCCFIGLEEGWVSEGILCHFFLFPMTVMHVLSVKMVNLVVAIFCFFLKK